MRARMHTYARSKPILDLANYKSKVLAQMSCALT
jgi:hypothetical protein